MNSEEFRYKLGEITKEPRPGHQEDIEALKATYNHNIKLIQRVYGGDDCFQHIFRSNLPRDILKRFNSLVENSPDVFKRIVRLLIHKNALLMHDEKKDGDQVVIYFDKEDPTHFGKIVGNKIESKWGSGCVWLHDLFEVPLSYGKSVKYSDGILDLDIFENILSSID